MQTRRILAAIAFIAAVHPAGSYAREWGSVAGWAISPAKQSCGMFAAARGGSKTDMVLLKRLDGSIVMQLRNPTWNITPANLKRMQYSVDGQVYSGPVSVTSTVSNPQNNIIAAFGSGFERALTSGTVLLLMLDGRVFDQVSLAGSAAAIDMLQNCLNELRTVPANIPAPANTPGFTALAAKAPVPRNNPSTWISVEDYPNTAERERREGSVGFRLSVGKDGRTAACSITKTSGSADLDEATCKAMMRRTRFTPAYDANGNPVEGVFESRVSWKLPGT